MMKKIVKYSLSVLAVVVVLLLIAPFLLNVEDYKQQIEQQVEDATGRSLKIGGLQASLFPWVGITLDDVVLANRQGFSERDFLKVKHLDVQVALLPLFSKKLEIIRFKLEKPEIFMERNAKGEGNWEDLLPASPASITAISGTPKGASTVIKHDEKSSSILAALSAESLQLHDGKFIWQDAQSGVHIALTDVQMELDDVQLEHPIRIKISARLNGDKIDMDAQVGPLGDLATLDVNKLPIQLSLKSDAIRLKPFAALIGSLPNQLGDINKASVMLNAQLEQRPDGVRLSTGKGALLAAMNVALDWKVEMPNVNTLRLNHMGLAINDKPLFVIQGDVKQLNKAPRYTLRIQGENIQRTWLEGLLPELSQMYAAHPSPWQTLKVGASLAGTTERVDLRDMQVLLDGEILQLSGSVGFATAPNIRLRLAAKSLHLDPWLPQPAEAPVNNSADGSLAKANASGETQVNEPVKTAVEPDLRFLKPWHVSIQLQVEKLFMRGLALSHLRGTLKGERGVFTLSPLGFNLAGGQVRENASMNVNHYPVSWTESIHISELKLKPVLQALAGTDLLDGTLRLDTNLKATGLLPKASMASLSGTGQLSLQNGRIKGFDVAGSLRNLSSLGSQKSAGEVYTDFAQLQASFKIRHGIVKNDDLFLASPLFRLTGKGVVNLPASTLDYHVRPKLIGSLVGQGDTLTVRKGLSVPLHIYGPFASPSIKPELDAKSVLENVGGLMGSGAGGVGGVLGGIGNLLKGKKVPASKRKPAKINPTSQPLTPDQLIQKSIKGLLRF
ncbi:MAG: AsmA family protein [Mariprofundaceae bacterium]|nr:AsmA family protein [Mariprofundaceae bacterium]